MRKVYKSRQFQVGFKRGFMSSLFLLQKGTFEKRRDHVDHDSVGEAWRDVGLAVQSALSKAKSNDVKHPT